MALDTSSNPCALLSRNPSGASPDPYSELWFSTSDSLTPDLIFPKIFGTPGRLNTYLETLAKPIFGALDANMLSAPSSTSTLRLIHFLSNGTTFTKFSNIILKTGTVPESIVDNYFIGTAGRTASSYTYSTTTSPSFTDTNFWAPTDASEGGVVTSPVSMLGKLLNRGYLLKSNDIYNASQLSTNAAPTPGNASLIYLLRKQQNSQATPQEQARINTLESTNLRFFAAFLAEYCFYRSRYDYLLSLYFNIYKINSTTYPSQAPSTISGSYVLKLFTGLGDGVSQYQNISGQSKITQASYLRGLAYHMACLNTRMTDMRRLLAAINQYYGQVFTLIQADINSATVAGSNTDLAAKISALNDSASDMQKYLSETDYHKGVMEYNSEKNRYSNILLGLYAFLNISAAAMVFQLSRSS